MRTRLLLLAWVGLMITGTASACELLEQREIEVGTSKGIAGRCSNNDTSIQCIADGEGADRFSCDGIEGSYSGPDLQQLIATTCGCAAGADDSAQQLQQQELGDSPE